MSVARQLCILLMLIFPITSLCQSSLYSDRKARQVGDIVTVIITESSKASKSDETHLSKKIGANGSLSELFRIGNLPLKVGVDGSSGYTNSGSTTRSGSVDAKISATVKEVLPNGNLKLEGIRNVIVNNDVQTIAITGIVRPEDISADNTVLSIYMADAEIKYYGKGESTQYPGFVTKTFKILLAPFFFLGKLVGRIL